MKKNLYVIRHGETMYNLEYRWQGCGLDAVLNENGERQAVELAKNVQNLGFEVLYCSPLIRAVQTANEIARQSEKDLPIVILQDLREGNFGEAKGILLTRCGQCLAMNLLRTYVGRRVKIGISDFRAARANEKFSAECCIVLTRLSIKIMRLSVLCAMPV